MPASINVLFLAAEAEPFVKVGGLADVAGSLPLALRALPYQATHGAALDVRLVLPLHLHSRAESTTMRPVAEFQVYRSGGSIPAQVFETSLNGMPVYFISGHPLSASPSVYSPDPALDREKYAFFSLAVLEMLRHVDWQPDILHANDWHTALALYALRARRGDPVLARVRTLLTLHNLPYMGGEAADALNAYGLMPLNDDALPQWARTFFLPLGLWAADAIVPVSPAYAREILTPDFGCGLESYLNSRRESITGILNGLDVSGWDPAADAAIPAPFSAANLEPRSASKAALQKSLGLPEDPRIPLLAMVGRVDRQKGQDLAFDALRQSASHAWQFVMLGSGDPALENLAANLQADFHDRVRVALRYDAPLGRLIYAGADMFLMPSRYEPCGLAQMIAMRYGCVPVVRATGGLKDTVEEGRTGFLFRKAEPADLAEALERALGVYANPAKWQRYQRNGMSADFSWPRPARQYAMLYHSLTSS
ncbi:MAG: starch synthase [Anaerolineaceae bacterium]|nr:MAG: starch synthase [Anaerolineaceae bacterium]